MGLPHSTSSDQHPTCHPGTRYIADRGALENSSCALPVREEVCMSRASECLFMASTLRPLTSRLVSIDCGRISRSHTEQPDNKQSSRLLRILAPASMTEVGNSSSPSCRKALDVPRKKVICIPRRAPQFKQSRSVFRSLLPAFSKACLPRLSSRYNSRYNSRKHWINTGEVRCHV
jgi:hypothetical protein